MLELITTLFGVYSPVTYTVAGETYVAGGFAGVDWPWIAGVALFAVVLLSFFKLVGVLLKK